MSRTVPSAARIQQNCPQISFHFVTCLRWKSDSRSPPHRGNSPAFIHLVDQLQVIPRPLNKILMHSRNIISPAASMLHNWVGIYLETKASIKIVLVPNDKGQPTNQYYWASITCKALKEFKMNKIANPISRTCNGFGENCRLKTTNKIR